MHRIICIIFFTNLIFSQEFYQDGFPDSSLDVELKELGLELQGIKKLEKTIIDKKKEHVSIQPLRFQWKKMTLEELKEHPPVMAIVPRHTKVFNLETKTWIKTSRKLYVRVLPGYDEVKSTYILNKRGEIKYQVVFKDIIPIKDVTQLHEQPRYYQEYSPKSKKIWDTVSIFNELSFVTFYQSSDYLSQTLNTTSDPIQGTGVQHQVLCDFSSPLILGLETNYLIGNTETGLGDYNLSALTTGPVASLQVATFNKRKVFAQVASQFSVLYHLEPTDDRESIKYDSQMYSLGLRSYWPSSFAEFVIGLKYSWEFLNPKSSSLPESTTDKVTQDNTLALSVGVSW